LDAPLGQDTQNIPAGARAFINAGKRFSSSAFSFVKRWTKSSGPSALDVAVTPAGGL
jgi:hypothetical protein